MKHHIRIHPVAALPGSPEDTAGVSGAVVTVSAVAYDLSAIPVGAVATPEGEEHPFVGAITRDADGLHYGLALRYDAASAEPEQPGEPAHWQISVEDAPVPDLVIRGGQA